MRDIVTVTLNPAIDLTVSLDELAPGTVHRAHSVRRSIGGKGINVASCLADAGIAVIATGLLGEEAAPEFSAYLLRKGITDRFVAVPGNVRNNLKLVDQLETTDINLPGIEVPPDALRDVDAFLESVQPGALVVLSGSAPPGCPETWYGIAGARLSARGVTVVLDTSGPALDSALRASSAPFCIKPNEAELAEWAGRPLPDLPSIVAEIQKIAALGVSLVVVSLGSRGALFARDGRIVHARLETTPLGTTVGAGDALLAGIVFGIVRGDALHRIARVATAFAVGKLQSNGSGFATMDRVSELEAAVGIEDVTALGELS